MLIHKGLQYNGCSLMNYGCSCNKTKSRPEENKLFNYDSDVDKSRANNNDARKSHQFYCSVKIA